MRRTSSLFLDAIADQVGDGNDLEPVFLGKKLELGHAGHRAVVVHYLADDGRRLEAGDTGDVDACLGLADTHQHAAVLGPQGKNVARTSQVRGLRFGSTAVKIVFARSAAEMPVVTPTRASIEVVNAVPILDVFSVVCGKSWSSLQRSSVSGKQISPRPWTAIKLMISGVTFSAAQTRSPSFSRSSSSTMIIILPAAMSRAASSTEANGISSPISLILTNNRYLGEYVRITVPNRRFTGPKCVFPVLEDAFPDLG